MKKFPVLTHKIEGYGPSRASVTVHHESETASASATAVDPTVAFYKARRLARQLLASKLRVMRII